MLARKYEPQKIHQPLWAQPKLNGVRAYAKWNKERTDITIASRTNKIFERKVLSHLYEDMKCLPTNIILDGELYVHGWSLQRILGAVNRSEPNEDSPKIEFHAFDCFIRGKASATFGERLIQKALIDLPLRGKIYHVYTQQLDKLDELDQFHVMAGARGFEGSMIRFGNCLYQQGERSHYLMKRKDWMDEDYEIIGVYEGKDTELGGKYTGTTGSLILKTPEGKEFRAGSGLTDKDRNFIWSKRDNIKGTAKVKYEMLSSDNVPLKPVVLSYEILPTH